MTRERKVTTNIHFAKAGVNFTDFQFGGEGLGS